MIYSLDEEDEEEEQCYKEYDGGRYSPRLLHVDDLPLTTIISDEDEDRQRLHFARKLVLTTGQQEVDIKISIIIINAISCSMIFQAI